jgi:hypothetical protein
VVKLAEAKGWKAEITKLIVDDQPERMAMDKLAQRYAARVGKSPNTVRLGLGKLIEYARGASAPRPRQPDQLMMMARPPYRKRHQSSALPRFARQASLRPSLA